MTEYESALASLNAEQLAAVKSEAARLLILAGPGTGKTQTLTMRIAHHLNECRISGYSILALTFTRKAAAEMRTRLEKFCPASEVKKIRIGTFHAVCLRIIHEWAETLGYKSKMLSVYDEADQEALVKRIAARFAHGDKVKALAKDALLMIRERAEPIDAPDQESEVKTVVDEYYLALRRQNAMDYDMLVGAVIGLFKACPAALAHYRNNWGYVFVDEYQDTDAVQQEFIDLLLGGDNASNLTVVGDPDQSVFGFRHADPSIILGFGERYPGSEIVILVKNYRSTPQIIEASNNLIRHNQNRFPKELEATRGDNGEVIGFGWGMDEQSAVGIVDADIKYTLFAGGKPGDITILARTNRQLEPYADVLRESGIPYQLVTPYDCWKSIAVKRAIDAMRLSVNPFDDHACLNLLLWPTPVFADDIDLQQFISDQVAKGESLWQGISESENPLFLQLKAIVDSLSKENFVKNSAGAARWIQMMWGSCFPDENDYRHLAEWIEQIEEGIPIRAFLARIATRKIEDDIKTESDTVKLMTAHSAKGLEFGTVFVVGCIEGKFPMTREDSDPEEERRLFYVACTRAKDRLHLSYPRTQAFRKIVKPTEPSRFLAEMRIGGDE